MTGRGRGRGLRPEPVSPEVEPAPVPPAQIEVDQIAEAVANVQVQHQSVLEASSISIARGRGVRGTTPNAGSRGRGRGATGPALGSSTSSVDEPSASTSAQQFAEQVRNVEQDVPTAAASDSDPSTPAARSSTQGSETDYAGYQKVHMKPKEPTKEPVIRRGKQGTVATYATNFIRVKIAENKGYYEYRVDFNPPVEDTRVRKALVKQGEAVLGQTRSYDGRNLLYLPIDLNKTLTQFKAKLPTDSSVNVVTVQYVQKLELIECVQFYNVLLNSIQRILGLVEMGRNFYDPRITHDLPQHKLEIWPGYVTRIDEVEAGLMLCLDVSHRVLRKSTVLEMLELIQGKEGGNYKEKFKEYIVGKLVVTKYKHNCYKIDDTAWNANPTTTFNRKGTEVRYMDYYKQQYDLTVTNLTQPMLISKPKKRRQEKPGEERVICLIPELCNMSGLSDEMTSNFTLMKDMATVTRLTPQQRVASLETYIQNVNNTQLSFCVDNPEVMALLDSWGIMFAETLAAVEGRIIGGPDIHINERCVIKPAKPDFSKESTSNTCYQPIALRHFVVICTKQDKPSAETMLNTYSQVCGPLGIKMGPKGRIITVDRISANDYRKVLKEVADPTTVQLVIVLLPSARDDLYGAVKQHCIVETPIPSQVLLTKTLRNDKRIRSVMQKVALQINCKLGGAIWALGIPVKSTIMFVGVDVYHDPKRKNPSVTALVATLDTKCTSYFSRVIHQKPHQESVESIKAIFCLALSEYCKVNGAPPDRIVVFRDGVSDGQMELLQETEVQQLVSAIEHMCPEKIPLFTFAVVQKRISERFFAVRGNNGYGNPPPGSVIDRSINRKYYYDFFIVSQLVRQGTVSPTHFVVLEDTSDIKPDLIQKFAFATTFMYFNWPGTIRVPAMCQYTHKLVSILKTSHQLLWSVFFTICNSTSLSLPLRN